METTTEEVTLAYEEVHLRDFSVYDGEDNNGFVFGIHYGEFYPEEWLFSDDREVQWFKTEEGRDMFIAKELTGYTSIDKI